MACAEDIGENRTMNLDLLDALKPLNVKDALYSPR